MAERVEFGPSRKLVLLVSVACGAPALISAVALSGTLSAAIVLVVLCATFWGATLAGHVWVDAERVGSTRPFGRGSCRRDDLERILLEDGYRGSKICTFGKKDGTVAFRVPLTFLGEDRCRSLAQFLGVPFGDSRQAISELLNLPPR